MIKGTFIEYFSRLAQKFGNNHNKYYCNRLIVIAIDILSFRFEFRGNRNAPSLFSYTIKSKFVYVNYC